MTNDLLDRRCWSAPAHGVVRPSVGRSVRLMKHSRRNDCLGIPRGSRPGRAPTRPAALPVIFTPLCRHATKSQAVVSLSGFTGLGSILEQHGDLNSFEFITSVVSVTSGDSDVVTAASWRQQRHLARSHPLDRQTDAAASKSSITKGRIFCIRCGAKIRKS